MTSEISATASSSVTQQLYSETLSKSTKVALEALKVDTTNIKTEADGKVALKAAQKKAELKGDATQSNSSDAQKSSSVSKVEDDIQDTYVSSSQSTEE